MTPRTAHCSTHRGPAHCASRPGVANLGARASVRVKHARVARGTIRPGFQLGRWRDRDAIATRVWLCATSPPTSTTRGRHLCKNHSKEGASASAQCRSWCCLCRRSRAWARTRSTRIMLRNLGAARNTPQIWVRSKRRPAAREAIHCYMVSRRGFRTFCTLRSTPRRNRWCHATTRRPSEPAARGHAARPYQRTTTRTIFRSPRSYPADERLRWAKLAHSLGRGKRARASPGMGRRISGRDGEAAASQFSAGPGGAQRACS
jgi:hypothetical protein